MKRSGRHEACTPEECAYDFLGDDFAGDDIGERLVGGGEEQEQGKARAGAISDRIDRRHVFCVGLVTFAVTYLGFGLTTTPGAA